MSCACGKNRRSAAPAGSSYTYEFTSPDGLITETYLTPLEAKRAVRRSGGGTIRRTTIKATA